ncbi:expressed unknown protein [Seminavis robusta]|uniref:Uncharacterized protein n=1 Tax=Seminavis robusta TaxID=568900 RepID=A0A9N8DCT5_9STRA|nr:expressed unknown protein [Seminavis robusta]|eukprot:Sro81_g043330.1 n/a (150) ;mRNA; f:12295-12744
MFTAGYLFRDLWSGSQSAPPITTEDLLQVFKQHSPKDPFSMLTKEAVRQIVKEQIQITPQEENVCPTAREDILHLIKQQEQIEETLQEVKVSTVTTDDILQIVKEQQSVYRRQVHAFPHKKISRNHKHRTCEPKMIFCRILWTNRFKRH